MPGVAGLCILCHSLCTLAATGAWRSHLLMEEQDPCHESCWDAVTSDREWNYSHEAAVPLFVAGAMVVQGACSRVWHTWNGLAIGALLLSSEAFRCHLRKQIYSWRKDSSCLCRLERQSIILNSPEFLMPHYSWLRITRLELFLCSILVQFTVIEVWN